MGGFTPPRLLQPQDGYRYSIDALILASFCIAQGGHFWCDLGTGCGVIAHQLATRMQGSCGFAVERQQTLVDYAHKNLQGLPIRICHADIRQLAIGHIQFDLMACNPPFFQPGNGRVNKHQGIAEARHAFHGSLRDFMQAMRPFLNKRNGRFCFILPCPIWSGMVAWMQDNDWFPYDQLDIVPFPDREAKQTCVAVGRTPPPFAPKKGTLILYKGHRDYTAEALAFLRRTRTIL